MMELGFKHGIDRLVSLYPMSPHLCLSFPSFWSWERNCLSSLRPIFPLMPVNSVPSQFLLQSLYKAPGCSAVHPQSAPLYKLPSLSLFISQSLEMSGCVVLSHSSLSQPFSCIEHTSDSPLFLKLSTPDFCDLLVLFPLQLLLWPLLALLPLPSPEPQAAARVVLALFSCEDPFGLGCLHRQCQINRSSGLIGK